MKKNYILLSLLFVIISVMTSCRKESPVVVKPSDQVIGEAYWTDVFQTYWDGMNYNYVFWDIDKTDWDDIYNVYKPKFNKLDGNSPEIDAIAVEYFTEISAGLIDHHYNLELKSVPVYGSQNEILFPSTHISPSNLEVKKRSYYHDRDPDFTDHLLGCLREKGDKLSEKSLYESADGSMVVLSALYEEKVAYLYFSSFSLSLYIDPQIACPLSDIIDKFNDVVNNEEVDGFVLDLRHNGGGIYNDLSILISDFIPKGEPLIYARQHYKKGMGRLDYTPHSETKIMGESEVSTPDVTCVVLVDLYSVSMSEMTTLALKALFPKVIVIGERTWGGQGALINDLVCSGGQFSNSEINVYTASQATFTLEGESLEGIGITPDVEILYNDFGAEFEQGTDRVFEEAIKQIYKSEGIN